MANMNIKTKLAEDLKSAMKENNTIRKNTVQLLRATVLMEEKNKPKRRIRKYVNDEDWQSVNLGKIATFSKGRGYSKSDLTENGGQPEKLPIFLPLTNEAD